MASLESVERITMNPDSVTLEDVQGMTPKEFRIYTFLKLNEIDKRGHVLDHGLQRLDRRLWYLGVGIILAILTAALG